jgi:hypothetical protein
MTTPSRKRAFGKVTLTFSSVIIVLIISVFAIGFIMSSRIDGLQTDNNSLQSQISSLQTSKEQLQNDYGNLQSRYNQLNSQYQDLQTNSGSSTTQTANLQSQITSLEVQLANATALISQLQGQTGILLTYSDLAYVGPIGSGGAYWLQLSLKNTGSVPITQIYVTINSVSINMPFTYLNSQVSSSAPLPAYQTATGKMNVTPPINNIGTYQLIIQAVANSGTTYTYQTTITAH